MLITAIDEKPKYKKRAKVPCPGCGKYVKSHSIYKNNFSIMIQLAKGVRKILPLFQCDKNRISQEIISSSQWIF